MKKGNGELNLHGSKSMKTKKTLPPEYEVIGIRPPVFRGTEGSVQAPGKECEAQKKWYVQSKRREDNLLKR